MDDDDDGEWETSSETSDANVELTNQMSPLEDIIRRSLDALNPSSADSVTAVNVQQITDENSAQESEGGEHVIGMNLRTVEFMTALGRQFKPVDLEQQKQQDEDTGTEQTETKLKGKLNRNTRFT